MKFNCKFYLEGSADKAILPIYLYLTFVGQRVRYYTGYRILASKWINTTLNVGDGVFETVQRAAKNSTGYRGNEVVKHTEINSTLEKIRFALKNMLTDAQVSPSKDDVTTMLDNLLQKNTIYKNGNKKKEIKISIRESNVNAKIPTKEIIKTEVINDNDCSIDFWGSYDLYIAKVNVSSKRRKQHQSARNLLKQFEVSQKISLSFDTFLYETIDDYEHWLLATLTRKKTMRSQNYVSGLLKKLSAFFNWIIKYFRTNRIPFSFYNPLNDYKIKPEVYGDPYYLTKEERDKLYAFKFNDVYLETQRDIFIFQCLCGARVGDMMKFTPLSVCEGILYYIAAKTSCDTQKTLCVPLKDIALDIVKKYENNRTGLLLPFISDTLYNRALKDIFRLAGLNRIVTRLNPVTRLPEQKRLYELASSHMARRTFVGVLHSKNVKNEVISSMTGHSPNSRSYTRYRTVVQELKVDAINTCL